MLHALSTSDVPEAQRLAATLLGPLADAHATLQPMLQQTMQWFMQTDHSAVQGILQSEKSAAMLALSSHFPGLSGPAKRCLLYTSPSPRD